MKKELYYNFRKSLEQKYNAVCFDIDGTLTEENSKKIDDRAVKMIVELLKRKIPIVFITGRGETGLNDLKNDIYDSIINSKCITENDIKRIYVLTNDGARLFYSNNISYEDFLLQNVYITTMDELEQLKHIDEVREYDRERYYKNKEQKLEYAKTHYQEKHDEILEKQKARSNQKCYDPKENDICSLQALQKRKRKDKEKYKDVVPRDCIIKENQQ